MDSCCIPRTAHSASWHHVAAVHTTAVHTTAVHTTAVHTTAVHTTAVHTTAVHTTAVHTTAVHTTWAPTHPAQRAPNLGPTSATSLSKAACAASARATHPSSLCGPALPLRPQQARYLGSQGLLAQPFCGDMSCGTWGRRQWRAQLEACEVMALTPDVLRHVVSHAFLAVSTAGAALRWLAGTCMRWLVHACAGWYMHALAGTCMRWLVHACVRLLSRYKHGIRTVAAATACDASPPMLPWCSTVTTSTIAPSTQVRHPLLHLTTMPIVISHAIPYARSQPFCRAATQCQMLHIYTMCTPAPLPPCPQLTDFGLIVIDEAHHCRSCHPYAVLMADLYEALPQADRPHLLALSGSPLHAAELQQQLHARIITPSDRWAAGGPDAVSSWGC
jgi:hypothetical protein